MRLATNPYLLLSHELSKEAKNLEHGALRRQPPGVHLML